MIAFSYRGISEKNSFFTIERGNRKRARLKYQTRARKIVVLARLDLDGPHHRNPPNSPYRPNERLPCPHLHLYREGFDGRVAFLPHEVSGFALSDVTNGLGAWKTFCASVKFKTLRRSRPRFEP